MKRDSVTWIPRLFRRSTRLSPNSRTRRIYAERRLETLECRALLAVIAANDTYATDEDTAFTTGLDLAFGFGSRGGWAIFDELPSTSSVYPDTNQGAKWYQRAYDPLNPAFGQWDGAIGAGLNAPFDYGGIDYFNGAGTPIDAPAATETTVLARRKFTLTAEQAAATEFYLGFVCDDGCAYYLNDTFLGVYQLPVPVTANARATTGGVENDYQVARVDLAALGGSFAEGENLLALEAHNVSATSSDLGFDVFMYLEMPAPSMLDNDDLTGATAPVNTFYWDGVADRATTTADTGPVFDVATGTKVVGTVTVDPAFGDFDFTPATSGPGVGFSGAAQFRYVVRDSSIPPVFSTATVTINITPVNSAPVARGETYHITAGAAPLAINVPAAPTYLAPGSTWFYSHDGSNQDVANPEWKAGPAGGFNPASGLETGWVAVPGPAPLGFGGDGEVSALTSGHVTYYFQRKFDITGPIPSLLQLGIQRDDCAVVYINGVEVDRSPTMPAGQTNATLCNPPAVDGANEGVFIDNIISTAGMNLQATGNTISVEVHQVALTSSDINFDLRLNDARQGLMANDFDHDDPRTDLHVVVVDQSQFTPAVGTLVVQPTGAFTFTPASASVAGTYSFTYRVVDDGSPAKESGIATATIVISPPVNVPVTAIDDTGGAAFTTAEDTPLVVTAATRPAGPLGIGVLANDATSPAEYGQPLTLTVVSQPTSGGTVTLNNDGSFSYSPPLNYFGTDTWTYRVNDGASDSNVATVEVVVTSVDDVPVARDDSYPARENTVLQVVHLAPLFGRGAEWSYFDQMQNGLQINPAGAAESYPTDSAAELDATPGVADAWNTEYFNVSQSAAAIGVWQTARGIFAAPLNGLSFGPATTLLAGVGDSVAPAGQNTVDTYLFRRNFTVTDGSAVRQLLMESLVDGGAVVYINGREVARLRMPEGQVNAGTLALGGVEETYESYLVDVPPGVLHDGVNTIAVEVHQTGRTNGDVGFDMSLAISPGPGVLANDSDPDGTPVGNATVVEQPLHGTVTMNADGTFTYTPTTDFHGTDFFRYTTASGEGISAPATVYLSVEPAVEPPTAVNDVYTVPNLPSTVATISAAQGVLANDTVQGGGRVVIELSGSQFYFGPEGVLAWNSDDGVYSDGGFEFDPEDGFVGALNITYTVENAGGARAQAILTINVVSPSMPGDLDGDHDVDRADLAKLVHQYGRVGATPSDGDLDGDSDVDVRDAVALRNLFTANGSSPAAALVIAADHARAVDEAVSSDEFAGERANARLAAQRVAAQRRERVANSNDAEVLPLSAVRDSTAIGTPNATALRARRGGRVPSDAVVS